VNAYDQVAYVNRPYSQTHPDHLAVIGRLHGLDAPPVERARVLDLGASEGGNIIPMAISLPEAQFTGVDLAAVPVERGNQVIRDLGLSNVRLLQMDLLEMGEDLGEFDYIIAHGLYAWTPPAVRDKILAIARAHLSPNGIAFISYNAYSGGHLRKVLREAMLLHIGDAIDPAVRLERARGMLQLFALGRPEPDEFDQAFAAEAAEVLDRSESSLFHDYLAEIYEPAYLGDFVAHAGRHQLQYLADAGAMDSANPNLSPGVMEAVAKSAANRIEREQYLDILRLRRFRQSLVCRAEVAIEDEWITQRAVGMFAAAPAEETAEGQFTGRSGVTAKTDHPAVIAFLRKLIAIWPRAERVAPAEAEMALKLFHGSMIDLRTTPGIAGRAGERPTASPLARYQSQRGDEEMSSLMHMSLPVGGDKARAFLALLDGTRDRAALAREAGITAEEVETLLAALGRLAMLVA
jgi:SAM-dependent methyltransferase